METHPQYCTRINACGEKNKEHGEEMYWVEEKEPITAQTHGSQDVRTSKSLIRRDITRWLTAV